MPAAHWFGDRAVLIPVATANERQALLRALDGGEWQVRSGMREVLVEVVSPERDLLDRVSQALAAIGEPGARKVRSAPPDRKAGTAPDAMPREVVIEVVYDGDDLRDVADLLSTTVEGVVAGHTTQLWRVAMMGFAPGFGYLEPSGPMALDWACLERRSSPRSRVPRGSVAVAAGMSAVYPAAMPGGWHLLGSTEEGMFDATRVERPALLASGDLVRFVSSGQL